VGVPISIRLEDSVREELETQAQARGVGLSTYIRDLATEAARQARRARIRAESRDVGAYVARSADAQAFYRDWGAPGTDAE
jgi:cytidylate kinase